MNNERKTGLIFIITIAFVLTLASCLSWPEYFGDSIEWAVIPAGTFQMGCVPQDTNCDSEEQPRHMVSVSAFKMMPTEVTNAQFFEYIKKYGDQCGDEDCIEDWYSAHLSESLVSGWSLDEGYEEHPVFRVTWYGAKAFCKWIGGRLPSEAEWEYAARAGTNSLYICGDDESCLNGIASFNRSSSEPVGSASPNGFGLYDMSGSATEWVEDCWHSNYSGAPTTGESWDEETCNSRVRRGGGYKDSKYFMIASARISGGTSGSAEGGFRCVKDLESDDEIVDGDINISDTDGDEEIIVEDLVWTDTVSNLSWQKTPEDKWWYYTDAMDYCDQLELNGNTDWRLPSIRELRSMVRGCPASETGGECPVTSSCAVNSCDSRGCDGCEKQDACFWPEELEGECSYYWSATYKYKPTSSWAIKFDEASFHGLADSTKAYARCVRDADPVLDGDLDDELQLEQEPEEELEPEVFSCSNGICTDPLTEFEWQQNSESEKMGYEIGKTYCEELDLDGGGWRLPNISELRSLVRNCDDIELGGSCGVWDICSACNLDFMDVCLDLINPGCLATGFCSPSECTDDGGPDGCYWPKEMSSDCAESQSTYFSSSLIPSIENNLFVLNYFKGKVSTGTVHGYARIKCIR